MKKKLFSILTLALLVCSGAWATQTSLITDVTLPDVPTTTLDLSSQTSFTADNNGWIVLVATDAIPSTIPTWFAINGSRGTQSPQSEFKASTSSTTAPFVDCNSGLKINKYSPDAAIRFAGAEKASFLVSARSTTTNKEMYIALFTYDSNANPTQAQVGSTLVTSSKDPQELTFSDLEPSNTYIAYIYGGSSGQNGSLMEIALKAPTKTVATQALAGVKKGDNTLTENTDYTITTVDDTNKTIVLSDDYVAVTAPTDITLINRITYTDASTNDKDVAVELEENTAGDYFEGTTTIGLITYTVKVPVDIPTSAPTITTDLETTYNVVKGSTLTLSIVAEGATSYQWYLDNVAINGATTTSYTFTGTTVGESNNIYCAAINVAGSTNSTTATITTQGRTDCELTNIKFSNGAYGAINSAAYGNNTIAVPYMAGQSAPTVETSSIVVSDGATFAVDGTTLTVTAEDGTTTKEFTITTVAITPLEVTMNSEVTISNVPSWVFNLYGYDAEKGLKFAKAVDDATMRIAMGNTRQYYFIGAAKSLTLTKTGTTRKVNVYVNGTKVKSDTNNDALGAIALDEDAPCMVMIEAAAGTNGDGGFSKYAVEAVPVKLNASGFATYSAGSDFTVSGATAYKMALDIDGETLAGTAVEKVPAGAGVLLKGEANAEVTITATTGATELTGNDLKGTTDADGSLVDVPAGDIFVLSGDTFKPYTGADFAANKAFFQVTSGTGARSFVMVFEDSETTGIEAIEGMKNVENGKFYNLNGQQVAQPTKGLYIVNGRKVVIK